ncbi:MAG: isoamylase early set domain-containing protein [Bacteroidales bacterium]|nr:isoamylase early set domain-containing protein [Bacteroidales bacterium]MBN2818046.1 isoamylase early set domain-containing protein [Bacteroidales bacterium]
MSIKKNYLTTKPMCKVTFKLDKNLANSAHNVNLVGDFNEWNETNIKMKKLKNGDFSVSLELDLGKDYEFRYLVDSIDWLNEPEADKYAPNAFHSENSVVTI